MNNMEWNNVNTGGNKMRAHLVTMCDGSQQVYLREAGLPIEPMLEAYGVKYKSVTDQIPANQRGAVINSVRELAEGEEGEEGEEV